jgi:hypothetical protein
MYFIIDNKLKIIFGWSAKCGCTHIKNMCNYLQNGNTNDNNMNYHLPLPYNMEEYITILIIRNPYNRIISGFLDKYNRHGEFSHLWKNKPLTFNNFIDELIKLEWIMIDHHHFTLQTSEYFNENLILKSKKLIVYDINNINYNYISYLYNKEIPQEIINFKGPHYRKTIKKFTTFQYIYDNDLHDYHQYDFPLKYFFNDDIKNKIIKFYLNDFIFFNRVGFNYINSI